MATYRIPYRGGSGGVMGSIRLKTAIIRLQTAIIRLQQQACGGLSEPPVYLYYTYPTILHLCYTYTYAISFLNLYRGYTIPIRCLLYYGSTIAILYLYYTYTMPILYHSTPILHLCDTYTYTISALNLYRGYTIPILCLYYSSTMATL